MLTIVKVLEEARRTTGLHDFGDNSFLEGLEVLIKSANEQANFNDMGRGMFQHTLIATLSRRLEIEHWYALHPEIDEQEIEVSLIGLSLPRTGSTALGCTLALDSAARSLRMWESHAPCPPPEKATEHTDPRIAATEIGIEQTDKIFPRLKMLIPMSATDMVECHDLMALDFKTQDFIARMRIPDYVDWMLNRADLESTYRYEKRALKLLQWRCPPNRWRLKSPSHMPFIKSLNKVFPEAKFWMTHRDITKVMPSVVDTYQEVSRPWTDQLDGEYIIDTVTKWWTIGMERTLAFRDAGAESQFIDIQFTDFQNDPESCVRKIYEFLGEQLTEETRQKMAVWRGHQAKDKHGKHELDVIAAGMDLNKIRAQFKFYSDRFTQEQ